MNPPVVVLSCPRRPRWGRCGGACGWFGKRPLVKSALTALILISSFVSFAAGAEKESPLWDPEDGWLDLSGFLQRKSGFYPMVMPITEPAVGYGAAAVPLFIRLPEGGKGRPDIWGLGAMRTSNGSEGIFGGYSGYFDEQRYHVMAGGIKAGMYLDFLASVRTSLWRMILCGIIWTWRAE